MGFSTKECAWAQTEMKILGRTIVGIRGFEFEAAKEKEYLRGAGSKPIDIQDGDESFPGTLKLLKYEVDMLNEAAIAAGYRSLLDVPHEAVTITCVYKKNIAEGSKTISAFGIAFTSLKYTIDAGGKFTEVPLPFLAMDIQFT